MTAQARQRLLFATLGVLVIAAIALLWPGGSSIKRPAALTAEELIGTPEARLIHAAASEVRWHLAGDAKRIASWRELDEVPRTVLALSWVETGESDPRKSVFRGFGTYLAGDASNRPTPDDLGAAYEAIGAPDVASVCRQVQGIADHGVIDGGRLAAIDNEFLRARDVAGTIAKLNAYIRQHAAEIAALRGR